MGFCEQRFDQLALFIENASARVIVHQDSAVPESGKQRRGSQLQHLLLRQVDMEYGQKGLRRAGYPDQRKRIPLRRLMDLSQQRSAVRG